MKKKLIRLTAALLAVAALAALGFGVIAEGNILDNLFFISTAKTGYTSGEAYVYTEEFVSSQPIAVSGGEEVWFGPCEPAQYFHLVGFDSANADVTGKVRGKDLEIADSFNNGNVIYKYTVPGGVSSLVFSAPKSLAEVYTVTKTELSELLWRAYWDSQGADTDSFVGQSSYYEVSAGDKLYFGAVTAEQVASSKVYASDSTLAGTMEGAELVESFGGEFGLYCYTVPQGVAYARVDYDTDYEQYYFYQKNAASGEAFLNAWIEHIGIQLPLSSTVEKLSGKSALFLGDSITYGARDRAKIYASGGWAGRIGYYAQMDVTNNGVSGACITTGRLESHSEKHYILNNLLETNGTQYDYVIMHGLFNDASLTPATPVGTPMGKASFDPAKANVEEFAQALELLFYTARKQNPNAILGYIVNFETERAVDQAPYVAMAIQICEDWGIEYLDLYNMEGFSVTFDDGLHPDSAGYDSMYTLVANWMATLTGSGQTVTQQPTQVMSYNVYFGADVPTSKGISIDSRYLKVAQKIAAEAPDIAMLQEVTDAFKTVAVPVLSGYSFYGEAHPGTDEAAPIIWKTDKYTLVESGNFTADGSWCATEKEYPRTINYVVLQDKLSGKQLLVMSVHAQPDMSGVSNEEARNKTMALVAEKAAELSAKYDGIAAIVGGDFNMAVGSTAYNTLTAAGLKDIRATVNPSSIGSYSDWDRAENKFTLGDYLFMLGDVNATTYQVLTDDVDTGRTDGKTVHISDHSPIVTKITY